MKTIIILLLCCSTAFGSLASVYGKCNQPDIFCCKDGRGLPKRIRCDGETHCPDGEDEAGCSPTEIVEIMPLTTEKIFYTTTEDPIFAKDSEQFQCNSSVSIPQRWVCDGEKDCANNADEDPAMCANHTCSTDEFRCAYGKCIQQSWKCDRERDCSDNSDEINCNYGNSPNSTNECLSNEFKCANGQQCILKIWRCDGENDCGDNSDEIDCDGYTTTEKSDFQSKSDQISTMVTKKCRSDEFKCTNGKCILQIFKCDAENDCGDNSDEIDCPKAKST